SAANPPTGSPVPLLTRVTAPSARTRGSTSCGVISQVGLQPSLDSVLPSSQASVEERKPSPQTPLSTAAGSGTHCGAGTPLAPPELEPEVPPLLAPPEPLCEGRMTIFVVLGKARGGPCPLPDEPAVPDEPPRPPMPDEPAVAAPPGGTESQPAREMSNKGSAKARIRRLPPTDQSRTPTSKQTTRSNRCATLRTILELATLAPLEEVGGWLARFALRAVRISQQGRR